jgi:hypothetical protein
VPAFGTLLVAGVACVVAFRARLRLALVVVLAVAFLVPDTLLVPRQFTATSYLTVGRAVTWAFALGLVRRVARGEVDSSALRPRKVHLFLLVFVAVAFVDGVALAAPTTEIAPALHIWMATVDQLVFFWSVLAAIRAIDDDLWVARALGGVLTVSAVIAVIEHFTRTSYARWWFHGEPQLLGTDPALPLETRGAGVRVRAADDFALAFGWVSVILLPPLLAVAAYVRTRMGTVVRLLPGLVVVAVLWSQSRSALVGLAGGLVAFLVLARMDGRVTFYLLAIGGVGLVGGLLTSALTHPFAAAQSGSTAVRAARLPIILGAVAGRSLIGLGSAGLGNVGITTTDSSYLTIYASLGVIGIAALVAVLVAALGTAAGGLRAAPGPQRAVAAGVVAGILVAVAAPAAYDLFTETASTLALWLLVALGTAIGERTPVRAQVPLPSLPRRPRTRWAARLALPVLGVGLGALAWAEAPVHYTATYRFDAVPVRDVVAAPDTEVYVGQVLVTSICSSITNQALPPRTAVSCRDLDAGPGTGEVQVESPSASTTAEVVAATVRAGRVFPGFAAHPLPGPVSGKPTALRTAPVWLGLAGGAAAFLLPVRPVRRRRRRSAPLRRRGPAGADPGTALLPRSALVSAGAEARPV